MVEIFSFELAKARPRPASAFREPTRPLSAPIQNGD